MTEAFASAPTRPVSARPECLGVLLAARASALAEKTAYTFVRGSDVSPDSLSYASLLRAAEATASTELAHRVPGEPVLLAFQAGLPFVVAFWACAIAGAIAVPVRPPRDGASIHALRAFAEHSGARLVLADPRTMERAAAMIAEDPLLAGLEWRSQDLADTPSTRSHFPPVRSASIALLQYTSGSTGNPKGVMVTHDNILANEEAIAQRFGHCEDTVVVSCLPHYHDMGLLGGLVQPVYAGGHCVLISPAAFAQRPLLWMETISRYRATTSGAPGFAYALCTERATAARALDLSSWNVAFVGAEPVRRRVLDEFAQSFAPHGFRTGALLPCYGLAEATLLVSAHEKGGAVVFQNDVPSSLACCGTPAPDLQLAIVDPATRQLVPDGREGEIWLRGRHVAAGYWHDPEATSQTFHGWTANGEGPFLRSGDLGYLTSGSLFVSGRMKSTIIVDGTKYHAEDLEECAARCLGTANGAAAFAIEARSGEAVAIVAEIRRGSTEGAGEASASRIAREVVSTLGVAPAYVSMVGAGAIPRTTSGKVRRDACRELLQCGGLREICRLTHDGIPNRDASDAPVWTEASLAKWIVAEICERTGVASHDVDRELPFPALGLDSRDLFLLAEKLSSIAGRELDPALLWEYPTVRTLTTRLLADE